MERVKTGNPPLDRILSGGFPVAAINLVIGRPGTGKTVLAEQLAFSCATPERPALYLTTLSEPIENVVGYMQQFSFGDADRVGTEVIYESLEHVLRERRPEALSEYVRSLVQKHAPSLVVIDSIKALRDLMDDARSWRELVFDLARTLTVFRTVSLWVGEYDPSEKGEVEFAVADGIIEMHRVQTDSVDARFLRVAKLRGSSFLDGEHAFEITANGLQIYPRLVTPPLPPDYLADAERLSSGIDGLDDLLETGWLRGTTTMVAGPSGAGKTMLGLHFLREGAIHGEPGLLIKITTMINAFSQMRPTGSVNMLTSCSRPAEPPIVRLAVIPSTAPRTKPNRIFE
jgi:circadian clock protein KaiC